MSCVSLPICRALRDAFVMAAKSSRAFLLHVTCALQSALRQRRRPRTHRSSGATNVFSPTVPRARGHRGNSLPHHAVRPGDAELQLGGRMEPGADVPVDRDLLVAARRRRKRHGAGDLPRGRNRRFAPGTRPLVRRPQRRVPRQPRRAEARYGLRHQADAQHRVQRLHLHLPGRKPLQPHLERELHRFPPAGASPSARASCR